MLLVGGIPAPTSAPLGAQCSIPVTLSLSQPSGDHRPGTRDSLSRHRHAPDQEGRLFEKDSPALAQ